MSLLSFARFGQGSSSQRMATLLGVLTAATFLGLPGQALAKSKAGCELTLTRKSLIDAMRYSSIGSSQFSSNPHSAHLRATLFEKIKTTCADCQFEVIPHQHEDYSKYRIIYPDGWWFLISYDPGVIEIQCLPFESSFHDEFIRRMNRDLFQPAASRPLFLKAHANTGMGHVNLDFETTFDGDVRLLKDFLADLINHSAIGTGIIGHDMGSGFTGIWNARHPSLNEKEWDGLTQAFALVEAGTIRNITDFYNYLYFSNPRVMDPKYNFFNIHFDETTFYIELRFPYSQDSPKEFIDLVRIFEKRIALLKKKNVPISLIQKPKPLTSRQMIEQFLDYTSQAEVPFESSAYFISKAFREGLKQTGYRNYSPQSFENSLHNWGQSLTPRAAVSSPHPGPIARFCSAIATSLGLPWRSQTP